MDIKILLRAMVRGAIGVMVACGVVWIFGLVPPSRENTQSVIVGWLIGEAYTLFWFICWCRAKTHRYDRHPMIIELRRRGRVAGLPTPPWHGEDGA